MWIGHHHAKPGRWANAGFTDGYRFTSIQLERNGTPEALRDTMITDTRMQLLLKDVLKNGEQVKISIGYHLRYRNTGPTVWAG